MAKSSVEVKVNHLNLAISLEKKKWLHAKDKEKQLNCTLIDVCHKLSEVEGQAADAEARVVTVAQESVVAYKASKECQDDQTQYTAMTYLIGKNGVRSNVTIRFPGLELTFLEMESEESNDKSTPKPEGVAGPSSDIDPLPPIV